MVRMCGLSSPISALSSALCASLAQVYEVSAIQLLQPQALYAGVLALVVCLCTNEVNAVLAAPPPSLYCLGLLFLGCNCAFLLNFSCYLVIGMASRAGSPKQPEPMGFFLFERV